MKKCFEQKLSRASKRSSNENERYLLIASYFVDSFFFLYFSVLFVFVTYDYFYDRPFPVVINVLNQRMKMFRTLYIFSDSFGRYY